MDKDRESTHTEYSLGIVIAGANFSLGVRGEPNVRCVGDYLKKLGADVRIYEREISIHGREVGLAREVLDVDGVLVPKED